MENGLKPGDVVRLKSGGPDLTVVCVDAPGWVRVEFYDGSTHEGTGHPIVNLVKLSAWDRFWAGL